MPKVKVKDVKLTKAGKPRKKPGRPKSKKKLYFGPEVQDAIVRYNLSESDSERNRIYGKEIHKAFDKLCENIINTFKFTYFDCPFEDIKQEVTSFLVMNMHKYDHTKGSKAFSYFSIVAKNYLILHNNANYKKLKSHTNLDKLSRHSSNEYQPGTVDIKELTKEVIRYFEFNIEKIFKKKRDKDIAYAILELIKKTEEIENFNKKALYILIREMTNVNTSHITSVVNVFKKHYPKIIDEYYGIPNSKMKKIKHANKFF